MKSFIYFLFTIFSLSVSAQFSTEVETKYLEQINHSTDKMLHRQNFHNAELVCDSLFINSDNPMASRFLVELGKSYSIAHSWDNALFSIIRQRIVFPNDSMNMKGISILKESALHLNFTNEEINDLIEKTNKEKYGGHQMTWHRLVTTGFDLNIKSLNIQLLHYCELYQRQYPQDNNRVLEEIRTLIIYNIPPKKRIKMINREAANHEDWIKNLNKKQRMIFLRKEVKYYKNNKAKRQAKISLQKYKAQGMNFGQFIYHSWKWLWV